MADESNTPAGTGDAATNGQGPAVALQTVYIKDLSFEAPKGPFLPAQTQDPKISLNLSTLSNNIGQDAHEVVLSVTIEAKAGDIAVYLAEVKQAGVFLVRGFGADETRRILGSFAPNILFPYIRQTVSDVVVKGGFPPFLLEHANLRAPLWLDRALALVTTWPHMHKLHHSRDAAQTDSNYGNLFSFWDRLFGTYRAQPRAGHPAMTIGIPEFRNAAQCSSLAGMLAMPFNEQWSIHHGKDALHPE